MIWLKPDGYILQVWPKRKNPRQLSPTGVFIFIKLRAWQ